MKQDLLLFTQRMAAMLSGPELDGIVAHELCHSNRWASKFSLLHRHLAAATEVTLYWAAAHAVRWAVGGTGFWEAACTWSLGIAAAMTARSVYRLAAWQISNFISRSNEIKTDFASRVYRGSRCLCIRTEKSLRCHANFALEASMQPISSHPTFERRKKEIRGVFGGTFGAE